jgi:hypothetical protein
MLDLRTIDAIKNAILAGWTQRRIQQEIHVSAWAVRKYSRALSLNNPHWRCLEPAVVEALRDLRAMGLPKRAIARKLEIERDTVDRYLRDEDARPICACGRRLAGHPGFCHDLYPRRMVRENAKLKWEAA